MNQPDEKGTGLNADEISEITPRIAAALLIGLILIFALAIRYYRIGEPFGGFHSFNEGWYSVLTRNYEEHGILNPISIFGAPDYNVAPFYSQILYFVRQTFGESEANYRFVSIVFSLLSIYFVFLIGRRLFSPSAGLIAAALYAFAPVSVVLGRNVQTDSTYLALLLAGLYLYLKARDDNNTKLMALSGLLFGFSFFTKQFAILLIPAVFAWECIDHRGVRWLKRGHIWFAACAAAVPLPFIVYHLVVTQGRFLTAQWEWQAVRFALPGKESVPYLFSELLWGISPPIAVLLVVGIGAAVLKRGANRNICFLSTVTFILFFTFWRGHSYYMLSAAPFGALLAGDLLARKLRDGWNMLAVLIVCSLAATQSIAFLCNAKYERTSFAELSKLFNRGAGYALILSPGVGGSYRPPVHYYLPHAKIVTEEELERRETRDLEFLEGRRILSVSFAGRPAGDFPAQTLVIHNKTVALYLLGFIIYPRNESEFFFKVLKIDIRRHGPAWRTGIFQTGYMPDLIVAPLPPGTRYTVKDGWLKYFAESGQK
ncbi:MAG: glycosyltransferase family 39 protein [bacterium]